MASSTREYFLSFDAATKTLAFALLSLDRAGVGPLRERLEYLKGLRARLQSAAPGPDFDAALEMLDAAAEELAEDSRALVRLHAGDVSDLFPDRADKSISEQERIKAVRDYVDALVRPALESIGGAPVRVFIEFHPAAWCKSRVSAAERCQEVPIPGSRTARAWPRLGDWTVAHRVRRWLQPWRHGEGP
jgi:hypothetical protein